MSKIGNDVDALYGIVKFFFSLGVFIAIGGGIILLVFVFGAGLRYSAPIQQSIGEWLDGVDKIEFTVNGEVIE